MPLLEDLEQRFVKKRSGGQWREMRETGKGGLGSSSIAQDRVGDCSSARNDY